MAIEFIMVVMIVGFWILSSIPTPAPAEPDSDAQKEKYVPEERPDRRIIEPPQPSDQDAAQQQQANPGAITNTQPAAFDNNKEYIISSLLTDSEVMVILTFKTRILTLTCPGYRSTSTSSIIESGSAFVFNDTPCQANQRAYAEYTLPNMLPGDSTNSPGARINTSIQLSTEKTMERTLPY